MDYKKISIIIPCYNCENWLERSLNSLINQTCDNFEIIFIDDGSKDNSSETAKKILSKSNIQYKIIKKKNEGVSVARNVGIENSNGEILYFLDSDDYVEDTLCETIIETVEKNDVDIMFFKYKSKKKFADYDKYNVVMDSKTMLIDLLHYKFMYHICAFAVKKSVVIKNNIKFTEGARYGEDHEFIIKALCNSNKGIVLNKVLFNYCERDDSAVQKFTLSRIDSLESAFRTNDYMEKYYNDKNMNKEIHIYVATKIMYNIDEVIKFKKADRISDDAYEKVLDVIKKNKKYIKYYARFYKKLGVLRNCLLIYISPKFFINYKIKK
ncbi:MAG: glycosyltransferase family 2 protein [Clostridium sp.]|jgi:glycosyltransferase involved in cell wall biosynthesis|nr:glycosyltransferase family 2 protein [Clostridium sp.]